MTRIRSFAEAEEVLSAHVPQQIKNTGKHFRLDRMKPLLDAIDNPQDKLTIIHLAGTSGKTSTTYYITSLLHAAGKKVGTTVSPHVDSVTERVQINGRPISETEFYTALDEFMQLIDGLDPQPTYFELIVAFAYWYFVRQQVDYAVVETGLGGLLDATNVARRADKVCVITDIGLDHMNVLGNTIAEIAAQKAGIIHAGNTVLMHCQSDEIMDIVKRHCKQVAARLDIISSGLDGMALPKGLPAFQQRNFILAYATYRYVRERDDLAQVKIEQSLYVQVPGRMEKVAVQDKAIILDGAHNEQKMRAFIESFKLQYPDRQVTVLLALKQGKELNAVLPLLLPITARLIVTEYDAVQDLPIPSFAAQLLAEAAQEVGFADVVLEEDKDRAYVLLRDGPGDLGIITGSFYLISQLRRTHSELSND